MITKSDWETLMPVIESAHADSPRVGKRVKVVGGRKHLRETGTVIWHGKDRYSSDRYMSDAQIVLNDAIGRIGYRARIETESGDTFFVNADYLEVIKEQS